MPSPAKSYNVLQALHAPGGIDMGRWKGEQEGILIRRKTGWFGRWRQNVIEGNTVRWKQITRKLCGPEVNKGEAQAELAKKVAFANGPAAVVQSACTLRQYVEVRWEPDHIEHVERATQIQYRSLLKNHILPALGDHRLRDINHAMLQLWVNALARQRSSATVRTCLVLVQAIFKHASTLGYWQGPSPTQSVKAPRERRVREQRVLTEEQVTAILDQLREPARSLVMLLSLTGLRIGEALALDWSHVNLSDKPRVIGVKDVLPGMTIAVRRNWSCGVMKPSPKTLAGTRNVPIPATVALCLAGMRRDEGLVFEASTGRPIDAHNLANRELKRACKAVGLPRLGFHVFRHTLSTLAQANGMSIGDMKDVLGHSTTKTTMIYTHGSADRARKILDSLEIGGKVQ